MTPPMTPLSIVQDWKKWYEDVGQFKDDGMLSTMYQAVKTMEIILKNDSSSIDIERALAYLDCERLLSIKHDTVRNETQDLMYGLSECLHLTLNEMIKEIRVNEAGTLATLATKELAQTVPKPSISSNEHSDPIFTNKQEPVLKPSITAIDHSHDLPTNKQENLKPVILIGDPVLAQLNSRNELGLNTHGTTLSDIGNDGQRYVGFPLINNDPVETMDYARDNLEDPLETVDEANQVEKRNRSSRTVSRPLTYFDNDLDRYANMSLKEKRRAIGGFDVSEPEMKKSRDERELKCPECAYRAFTVDTWLGHLRFTHSKSPGEAGVALLCDCGVESVSVTHNRECDIAKFIVIRTRKTK